MAWDFGGRSLVDEVNHVNMVVSFCDIMFSMFTFFFMVMMWYNGLLVENVNNRILQTSNHISLMY